MRISSRRRAIAFFVVLGVCLVLLAVGLNVGWIILNWREGVLLFLGVIFFALLIAGLIVNTSFLVREIRRNEQHDSFINAVTHELKTPIASIRLYLQTLQHRDVDESQRREFYRLMLDDTDRLMGTVDQVLKAGEAGHKRQDRRVPVDFSGLVRDCVEVARTSHHLPPEALRYEQSVNTAPRANVLGDSEELRDGRFKRARQRRQVFRRARWRFPCASNSRREARDPERSRPGSRDSGGRVEARFQTLLPRIQSLAESREGNRPRSFHRAGHRPQARRPRVRRERRRRPGHHGSSGVAKSESCSWLMWADTLVRRF